MAKVERTLKEIKEQLTAMTNQNEADFDSIRQRIDAASTNLAGDIRNLASQINTGMSQEAVDRVKAGYEAAAVGLEQLAAETPDIPDGNA